MYYVRGCECVDFCAESAAFDPKIDFEVRRAVAIMYSETMHSQASPTPDCTAKCS